MRVFFPLGWEIRMGKQSYVKCILGLHECVCFLHLELLSFSLTHSLAKKPGGSDGETGGEGAFDGVRTRGHISRVPV